MRRKGAPWTEGSLINHVCKDCGAVYSVWATRRSEQGTEAFDCEICGYHEEWQDEFYRRTFKLISRPEG